MEVFARTANFLLYLIDKLADDTIGTSATSATSKTTKFVDHFGPFTIVSFFYMHSMAYSQLFQSLTNRNLPKFIKGCQFNGRTLTWKARFWLCHISASSLKRSEIKGILDLEYGKIIRFIRENLKWVVPEERGALEMSFERGEILYIINFDGKGENHHMVAAIMYVSCAEGSYINWFAVSDKTYDRTRFWK